MMSASQPTELIPQPDDVFEPLVVSGDPSLAPTTSPSLIVDPNIASSAFSGVVSLNPVGPGFSSVCSGALISSTHVLTAAHCFDNDDNGTLDAVPNQSSVIFNTSEQPFAIGIESISLHPDFSGFGSPVVNDDIAVVTLSQPAPGNVATYQLVRSAFTSSEQIVIAGFGRSGTGVDGFTTGASFTTRRVGQNVASSFFLDDEGSGSREVFLFDFDGPTANTNSLNDGLTLGNDREVTIGGGDSGGPSFLHNDRNNNGQIDRGELSLFGINTFSRSFSSAPAPFFGSQGGGIVVSSYLDFIDGNTASSTTTNNTPSVIGLSGRINISDRFQRFNFGGRRFENPVVIAGPLSVNGGQAATVRIRNVNSSGFEIRIEEYDSLDGFHVNELVSVLVVEAGSHELDDGTIIEAGVIRETTHASRRTAFTSNFSSRPVVLTQVTSQNGGSAVTPRLNAVNRDGFNVRLQEEEAADNIHVGENLSFLAIERGQGSTSGNRFDVQLTGIEVSSVTESIDFRPNFAQSPAVFASIQTFRGSDTAALRLRSQNSQRTRLFVQEERSADNEIKHTDERIGLFAIETGLIRGRSQNENGASSNSQPLSNAIAVDAELVTVNYVASVPIAGLNSLATPHSNFASPATTAPLTSTRAQTPIDTAEKAKLDSAFEMEDPMTNRVDLNRGFLNRKTTDLDNFWSNDPDAELDS